MEKSTLGEYIAQMRKRKQLTQNSLADKLGVSVSAVSKWETGKSMPDITLLSKIAEALDVSMADLLNCISESDHKQEEGNPVEETSQPVKKQTGKYKVVIACSVLVVCLLGAAAYWFIFRTPFTVMNMEVATEIMYEEEMEVDVIHIFMNMKYSSETVMEHADTIWDAWKTGTGGIATGADVLHLDYYNTRDYVNVEPIYSFYYFR